MKPPVERVKVSAKGKEILIRVKRHTGLEHWNEICRVAICRSLANPTPPPKRAKQQDSNIDMEWKTFAGQFRIELAALIYASAKKDRINIINIEDTAGYFRDHLERGIITLKNTKKIQDLLIKKV